MPAILGSTQIINVGGSANIQFGDLAWMSPKSAIKSTYGSGGGATGAFVTTNSLNSINLTNDVSIAEQPIVGNIS